MVSILIRESMALALLPHSLHKPVIYVVSVLRHSMRKMGEHIRYTPNHPATHCNTLQHTATAHYIHLKPVERTPSSGTVPTTKAFNPVPRVSLTIRPACTFPRQIRAHTHTRTYIHIHINADTHTHTNMHMHATHRFLRLAQAQHLCILAHTSRAHA